MGSTSAWLRRWASSSTTSSSSPTWRTPVRSTALRPEFASNAPRGARPEINVTPLVDVVLVLLIIFMVIAPQLEAGERVELPSVAHVAQKSQLEAVTVTVTSSGRYLVGNDAVEPDAL